MRKIFLTLFVTFFSLLELFAIGPSTQGSEFYFSFNRARPGREKDMYITVSSEYNGTGVLKITDALGNVATNYFSSGATTIHLAYANETDAGEVIYLTDLTNSCYSIATNIVDNRGYIVEAFEADETTPLNISLYATLSGSSTIDAANIYPLEALGNEYYLLSHVGFIQGSDILASEAVIVATEDNTIIEISPTCLLDNQLSTDNIRDTTITLNRGQSYQIRALETRDLTGTLIRTKDDGGANKCKRIAVFSGNQHGDPGDYEYEQIFPTHLWGNKYLAPAPTDGGIDVIRIVASEPCTKVTINGGETEVTLNQTEFHDYFDSSLKGCYIESDKPVSVARYTNNYLNGDGGPDASMTVLAPIEQTLDSIIFTTAPNGGGFSHSLSIVTKTDTRDFVKLYQLSGATWTEIDLSFYWSSLIVNTDYSSLDLNISEGYTYRIISTEGGFNAYVFGDDGGSQYAYSAGSAARSTEANFILDGDFTKNSNSTTAPCVGKKVLFEALLPYSYSKIVWDFGDGDIITRNSPIDTITHTFSDTKNYTVKMSVHKMVSDCYGSVGLIDEAETEIKVAPVLGYRTSSPLVFCKGASIASNRASDPYFAGNPVKYYWEDTGETTQSIVLPDNHGTSNSYVVATYYDCYYIYDTIDVVIRPIGGELKPDVTLCKGTSISFTSATPNTNGNPLAYSWDNSGETTQSILIDEDFGTTTRHIVSAEAGCLYRDTINVTIPAKVSNSLTASETHVCGDGNATITITATQNGPSLNTWEMSTDGGAFAPLNPGTDSLHYTYTATETKSFIYSSAGDYGCESPKAYATVTANSPFTAELQGTDDIKGIASTGTILLPLSGGVIDFEVTTDEPGSYIYEWTPDISTTSSYSGVKFNEDTQDLIFSVYVYDMDSLCKSFTNIIDVQLGNIDLKTIIYPAGTLNRALADPAQMAESFQAGYKTVVYNRYGQVVSEKENDGWDGTYKGQAADAGVYYYVIEYNTANGKKAIKGVVEVVK